jgi:heme-degrading monooxygenase HmoA
LFYAPLVYKISAGERGKQSGLLRTLRESIPSNAKGEMILIVVSNRLQVAKGREKDFEERFEGRARLVENMPGFIRLEILRPIKSDYYIVLTHWEDEASFRAWTDSSEFKEAHRNRPAAEIFAGPNVFEMHEVIQYAGKIAPPQSV